MLTLNMRLKIEYIAHHIKYESQDPRPPRLLLSKAFDLLYMAPKFAEEILNLYEQEILRDIAKGGMSPFVYKSIQKIEGE